MPGALLDPAAADRLFAIVAWTVLAAGLLCLGLAAGAVLLRLRNQRVASRWDRIEASFAPAVLDVMAGAPVDPKLQAIEPGDVPYFVGFLSRIAREVRGPELEHLAALARPFLAYPRRALRSRVPEERARAVAALGLLGERAEIALVIAALDDPAPLVAMSAARALTRRRDPTHAAAVLSHLERLRHWRPSFLAAMLAALGPDAAAPLRQALENRDLVGRARAVIAEALICLSDPAASDPAARVAATCSDPEVLAPVLRLLARVGQPEHLPIVRRLAFHPEEMVRVAAFQALAALATEDDLILLRSGMADPSVWVAEHAARGLASGPGRGLLAAIANTHAPRSRLARELLIEGAA